MTCKEGIVVIDRRDEFLRMLNEAKKHDEYHVEGAKLRFADLIDEWMEKRNVNRAQLAERLGVSRQYVTKILNGYANLTIATMVKLAHALECELTISMIATDSLNTAAPRGRANGAASRANQDTVKEGMG